MEDVTCQWADCDSPSVVARGLCDRDYRRARRSGRLDEFKAPQRNCYVCGEAFDITKHRTSCCSPHCSSRASAVRLVRNRLDSLPSRDCGFCLEPVPTYVRRDARYCSVDCQQASWYVANADEMRARARRWAIENDGLRRSHRHTRRARMYAVAYESFDAWEIAERDGWACSICDEAIDRTAAYPDPLSKSLDHVIPLSKGGSHTRQNAAVAHLLCNTRKRDKIIVPEGVTSPSAVAS